jgi:hypothetical protein
MTEAELAEIAQALEAYRAARHPPAKASYRAKLETLLVRHVDELLDSARRPRLTPLSRKAQEARRPPPPALLLEAEQDRPDIPAKARAVTAVRTTKKSR